MTTLSIINERTQTEMMSSLNDDSSETSSVRSQIARKLRRAARFAKVTADKLARLTSKAKPSISPIVNIKQESIKRKDATTCKMIEERKKILDDRRDRMKDAKIKKLDPENFLINISFAEQVRQRNYNRYAKFGQKKSKRHVPIVVDEFKESHPHAVSMLGFEPDPDFQLFEQRSEPLHKSTFSFDVSKVVDPRQIQGIDRAKRAFRKRKHIEKVKEFESLTIERESTRRLQRLEKQIFAECAEEIPIPKEFLRKAEISRSRHKKKVSEVPRTYTQSLTQWLPTTFLNKHIGVTNVKLIGMILNTVKLIRVLISSSPRSVKKATAAFYLQIMGFPCLESHIFTEIINLLVTHTPAKEKPIPVLTDSKIEDYEKMVLAGTAISTQSLSEQLDKCGDVMEYVFSSGFSDAIRTLLVYGAFAGFAPELMKYKIYHWCGQPPRGISMLVVMESSIKAVARVCRAIEDVFVEGIPLHDALFLKDPAVFNRMECSQLLMEADKLYTGLPKKGMFSRTMWLKRASSVLAYFDARLKMTSSTRPEYQELSRLHTKLNGEYSSIVGSQATGWRPMPFGIILGENPGIGKSQVIDYLAAQFCFVKGHQYTPDMSYTIDTTNDKVYMEGYVNQLILKVPELGTETKMQAEKKASPVIMMITSLLDSAPKKAPMAFENKDKIPLVFELMICDTNNMGLNFQSMVCNPAAFKRRFLFVKLDIKPEYRENGVCGLSRKKIAEKPPVCPLDLYSICAWYEHPSDKTDSKKEELCSNADIFEFTKIIRAQYIKHIRAQEYVKKLRDSGKFFDPFGDMGDLAHPEDGQAEPNPHAPIEGLISAFEKIKENTKSAADKVRKWFSDKDADIVNAYPDFDGFELMFASESSQTELAMDETKSVGSSDDIDDKYDNNMQCVYKHIDQNLNVPESTPTEREKTLMSLLNVDDEEEKHPEEFQTPESYDTMKCQFEKEEKEPKWDILPYDPSRITQELSERFNFESLIMCKEYCEFWYDYIVDNSTVVRSRGCEVLLIQVRSFLIKCKQFAVRPENDMLRFIVPSLLCVFADDVDVFSFDTIMLEAKELAEIQSPISKKMSKSSLGLKTVWSREALVKNRVTLRTRMRDLKLVGESVVFTVGSFVLVPNDNTSFVRGVGGHVLTFITFFVSVFCFPVWGFILVSAILYIFGYESYFRGKAVNYVWNSFRARFSSRLSISPDTVRNASVLLAVATATMGVAYLGKKMFSLKSVAESDEIEPPHKLEIKTQESLVGAGPGFKRVKLNGQGEQWLEMFSSEQGVFKDSLKDLDKKARRNSRVMNVIDKTGTKRVGFFQGIEGDLGCAPSHYFPDGTGPWEVLLSMCSDTDVSKVITKFTADEDSLVRTKSDLVFVRVTGAQFAQNIKFYKKIREFPTSGTACFRGINCKYAYGVVSNIDNYDKGLERSYPVLNPLQLFIETKSGMCGLPAIVEGVKSCFIAGIHVGANDNFATSTPIFQDDILNATLVLQARPGALVQCHSEPDEYFVSAGLRRVYLADLEEPVAKSPFRFENFENIRYLGKIPGPVTIKQKSRLKHTIFTNAEEDFTSAYFTAFGCFPTKSFDRPMMMPTTVNGKYISPYNNNLRKINTPTKSLDPAVMRVVVEKLTSKILSNLKGAGVDTLHPFRLDVALNGGVDDAYFDSIKMNTAGGFGFPGKKKDYVVKNKDGEFEVTPEVMEDILRSLQLLVKGIAPQFVHNSGLKDEAIKKAKCESGDTRTFFATNLTNLLLSRMFLSPFYSLMVSHSDCFYASIGINMHRDADNFYSTLRNFSENWMEFDYSGYDVSMPVGISAMANTVVYNVLKAMGYNDTALVIVQGLLTEAMHITVNTCNDLYKIVGKQPSGKSSTAEDNSLRGIILLMYAWYSDSYLENFDFFEYVLPRVYGDDALVAVKAVMILYFNNNVYFKKMKEIGMKITPASKDSEFQEFVCPEEASFLKRTFRKHPALNKVVGCLDTDSIYKMLDWMEPSSTATESQQMIMTISSALRESFFILDAKRYSWFRDYLIRTYEKHWTIKGSDLDTHFRTYDSLIIEYTDAKDELGGPSSLNFETSDHVDRNVHEIKSNAGVVVQVECSTIDFKQQYSAADYPNYADHIYDLEVELKQAEEDLSHLKDPMPKVNPSHYPRVREYKLNTATQQECDAYSQAYFKVKSIQGAIDTFSSVQKTHDRNRIQADVFQSIAKVGVPDESTEIKEENVVEISGNSPDMTSPHSSMDLHKGAILDFADYMRRWVELSAVQIPLATSTVYVINPLQLYLNEPSVIAKLRNFAYLRAEMKLRFSVSGSMQHWGRIGVAWVPKWQFNDIAQFYVSNNAAYYTQLRIWMSQLPTFKMIDVSENQPLDMDIPYINFQPMIPLWQNQTTAIAGTYSNAASMGVVIVAVYNQLAVVNNTTATGVTMQVYGNLENVSVNHSTATQISITTECDTITYVQSDEMKVGPVERVSSRVADVAGKLKMVPSIYPFAYATEIAAKGLSDIAHLFGWSAPPLLPSEDPPRYVRPYSFTNACTAITYSTGKKMTLDPLQEVAIGPQIGGSSEDELAISSITHRWSFLDQFTWTASNVPLTTINWQAYVHPCANAPGIVLTTNNFVQPTALAYGAKPFIYWHGTIEYRFEFVASPLHRGKFWINYDPNSSSSALNNAAIKLNKTNSMIVDLQETRCVTFCVHMARERYWLTCNDGINETYLNRAVGTKFQAAAGMSLYESVNGVITCSPFTLLTSSDASPITVNVFVRAGDDFAVNQLCVENLPRVRTTTQSDTISPDEVKCYDLNEAVLQGQYKAGIHFGEQPVSLRPYLLRFFTSQTFAIVGLTNATTLITSYVVPDIANPWSTAGGNVMDLLSYLRYSFLMMKGEIRKRVRLNGAQIVPGDHVKIYQPIPSNTITTPVAGSVAYGTVTQTGNLSYVPWMDGGVEFSLPYYSSALAWPSGVPLSTALARNDGTWSKFQTWNYQTAFENASATVAVTARFVEETAMSDSWNIFGWLSATPYVTTLF